MKETCLHALTALLVVFATGLLPVSAQNDATNRPPVQTFYLPIPEEDLLQTLTSIHGGASWTLPAEPIESYNSIVVFVDGTVIYYDQWEDGYEQDIANPNHIYSASNPTGTQIWGDGDPSNGAPPDYPHDKLYAGANEVYDTTFFGTEFFVPVGEDTANQNEIFQYTGATSPSAATVSTTSATSTCRPRRRTTRSRST